MRRRLGYVNADGSLRPRPGAAHLAAIREQITEAWKDAHVEHITRGVHSGPRPVGYEKGDDKRLIPNGYANAVQEAFRMRAEDEANRQDVARYLNAEGVRIIRRGEYRETVWSAGAARKLIANRAYLGEARYGDLVQRDAHDALVDERTYRLANRKEKRVSGERGDGQLLGGGLCRCGSCAGGLVYGKTADGYEFLRCKGTGGGHASIGVGIVQPYLLAEAWDRFRGLKVDITGQLEDEDPQAVQRMQQAEADLAELDQLLETGEISRVAHAKAYTAAEADLAAAQAALVPGRRAQYANLTEEDYRPALFDVAEGGDPEDLAAYTVPADVTAARRFMKEMLGTVTVATGRAPVHERVSIAEPEEAAA